MYAPVLILEPDPRLIVFSHILHDISFGYDVFFPRFGWGETDCNFGLGYELIEFFTFYIFDNDIFCVDYALIEVDDTGQGF